MIFITGIPTSGWLYCVPCTYYICACSAWGIPYNKIAEIVASGWGACARIGRTYVKHAHACRRMGLGLGSLDTHVNMRARCMHDWAWGTWYRVVMNCGGVELFEYLHPEVISTETVAHFAIFCE